LGIIDLINYNKGCYIGQEIIARIHFRGHVAKVMRGVVFDEDGWDLTESSAGSELLSEDGKQAGRITSICRSPGLGKIIALAMVRYDYREAGTVLFTSTGRSCVVTELPLKRN
jgi:folate-binding Fe-S cluster repair protein YgfZ